MKIIKKWFYLLFIVYAIFVILFLWIRGGVTVNIYNDADTPLKNLKFALYGNEFYWAELPPHGKKSVFIHPAGDESKRDLIFKNRFDMLHGQKFDVYIIGGTKGKIDMRVDNNSNVRWKDKTKRSPILY